MMKSLNLYIVLLVLVIPSLLQSQCFLTGADLSYSNEISKKGGIYKDGNGNVIDPFVLFSDEGTKIVRLRLWHTPSNITDNCGNPISNSSLGDVLEAAIKVKENGMQLKLAIHYSDYFADPSKQRMPKAWEGLSHEVLLDSISSYTRDVLGKLNAQNTLPDIVSVGNETTWGFIDATVSTNGFDWAKDSEKFNAGLAAIDLFNQEHGTAIKKAVHFTEDSAEWMAGQMNNNGVTNFDIIGVSYYPFFSPNTSIEELGALIQGLISDYGKDVMVFETGFAWTNGFSDNYNNFITGNGNVVSNPKSESGQRSFLLELAAEVEESGGIGVIYWEPGWITSDMCDQWGQGSSYENVAMFDTDSNRALSSFDFFEYCTTSIEEGPDANSITIFPNPVRDSVIRVENIPIHSKWELLDASGRRVLEGIVKSDKIQLGRDLKGIYFLSIVHPNSKDPILKKLIFE